MTEHSEHEQAFRTILQHYLDGKVSYRNTLTELIPFVFPVSNISGPVYKGTLIALPSQDEGPD